MDPGAADLRPKLRSDNSHNKGVIRKIVRSHLVAAQSFIATGALLANGATGVDPGLHDCYHIRLALKDGPARFIDLSDGNELIENRGRE